MEDVTRERAAVAEERGRAAPSGHVLDVHGGSCTIDSWGPDRVSCLVEALRALVAQYAQVTDPPVSRVIPLAAGPAGGEELLECLFEDVIDTLDVFSLVPVRFHLVETEQGGVTGDMEVVGLSEAHVVGRAPRSVSHHDLSVEAHGGSWRCHVVVGV